MLSVRFRDLRYFCSSKQRLARQLELEKLKHRSYMPQIICLAKMFVNTCFRWVRLVQHVNTKNAVGKGQTIRSPGRGMGSYPQKKSFKAN